VGETAKCTAKSKVMYSCKHLRKPQIKSSLKETRTFLQALIILLTCYKIYNFHGHKLIMVSALC